MDREHIGAVRADGVDVCLGRLESPVGYPRVFMSRYMAQNLPPPPKTAEYTSLIKKWPMMLNDRWGDCVVAAKGHAIQVFSTYGAGKEVIIPDAVIQKDYFTESGGRDSGLNIPQSLDYWVKYGLGGQALTAWASCNPKDPIEMSQSIAWFGGCYFGVSMPNGFINAINNHTDWDDTRGAKNPRNSHAIIGVAYNEKGPIVVTWGQLQQCSWAWIEKYADEADVLISPDWLRNVVTPGGLDLASLLADFGALTGKKPPILNNPPMIDWSKL